MVRFRTLLVAIVLGALCAPVSAQDLRVSTDAMLLGDPVEIMLEGVEPGRRVIIEGATADTEGVTWSSRGLFYADNDGKISTARTASNSGTYEGVAASGLIWSMLPVSADKLDNWGATQLFNPDTPRWPNFSDAEPHTITFKAYSAPHPALADEDYGSVALKRRMRAANIVETPVKDGQLRGVFYEPRKARGLPAVMLIGGSGGGIMETPAAILASHGFRVLALAWFDYEGRPDEGVNIPIEYFAEGIDWLRQRTGEDKIGIAGTSYGGMTSLMVASTYPEHIGAVHAGVPSFVHISGVSQNMAAAPTFTKNGEAMPFVDVNGVIRKIQQEDPERFGAFMAQISPTSPVIGAPIQLYHWNTDDLDPAAVIPVEKIDAPIFITGGEDDKEWPSAIAGDRIVARLQAHDFPHDVIFKRTSRGGHNLDWPSAAFSDLQTTWVHPVIQLWGTSGGDAFATAVAQRENFRETVAFLKQHLD